ncbi:MAG TPA: plastocyanin/azurin family copper-binding protein [Solirubrobacteraceae bacterium]|nr:plastocyanin/azurin family copper-binding protein [Solirubrobacteraceae bacterium]
MHLAALQLVPVLAAEKSKTVFYVFAAILVVWAIVVSIGIGLRNDRFPAAVGGERAIIAITALLVLATVASDVLTSGGSTAARASVTTSAAPTPPAEAPKPPTATTGTPAPPSPAAGSTTSLKLAANPSGQLSYNTKQLAAKAGTVTITMTNMSPLEHNVTVAKGSTVLGATPTFVGGTRTLTLTLKPGTYTFYCSVPGHRQAGMEGTLTVS